MPVVDEVQTSFTRGQVAPELDARADTQIYRSAMRCSKNQRLLVQGGSRTRDGTLYVSRSNNESHIYSFVFGKGQEYLVELELAEIRVWEVQSDIPTLVETITASIPWTTQLQVHELSIVQRGDKMFMAHQDFQTTVLTRTGATTFTIDDIAYSSYNGTSGSYAAQPFFNFQEGTTTLTKSGTTYTSSVDHFTSDHVGSTLRMKDGTNEFYATITVFTNATTVTATTDGVVAGTAADKAYEGTEWAESMFSAARGYAGAVGFSSARLALGGSTSVPSHYALSEASLFLSFRESTGASFEVLDTDAIVRPVIGDEVNEIIHFTTGQRLIIFTDGGVYYVPETSDQPVTPTNIKEEYVGPYEAEKEAKPMVYNDSVLFVVAPGRVVRAIRFDTLSATYVAPSNSLGTNVLNSIHQTAQQYSIDDEQESYAFFLNDYEETNDEFAGTIAVHLGIYEEELSGWTYWATRAGDAFVSIANVRRKLFAVARRNIGGTDYFFLEKFSDTVTMDCCTRASDNGSYTNGDTTVGYSTTDLGTETVGIVIQGYSEDDSEWKQNSVYLGEFTNATSINLTLSTMVVHTPEAVVGLVYDAEIETMDAFPRENGVNVYAPMRIAELLVKLYNTRALQLEGGRVVSMQSYTDNATVEVDINGTTTEVYAAPRNFSGIQRFFPLGWDRLGRVKLLFPYPLRATVLGITRRVAIGD